MGEAIQEEMQLAYQSLLQTGYTDKTMLEGMDGQWQEAGAGGFLAGLVFGGGSAVLGTKTAKSIGEGILNTSDWAVEKGKK